MLWLSQEDVLKTGIADMAVAQREIEQAFRLYQNGETKTAQEIPLKLQEEDSDEAFYSLPAYIGKPYDVAGIKWTTHHPHNKQQGLPHIYTVLTLSDPRTGLPLAMMEGSVISAMRTGAVSSTAFKYLADPQAESVLCCGAGVQARQQIIGACYALPQLKRVYIWGRTSSRAEALKQELSHLFPNVCFQTVSSPSAGDVGEQCDIIIGATASPNPYLRKEDFKDGSLYCHIGFHEIEEEAIAAFDHIVVDDFESGVLYSGQSLFRMNRAGRLDSSKLFGLLGELVTGQKSLRQQAGKKIMFDAFGLVIFDLALGAYAYRCAKEQGLGIELPLWHTPIWK